jgi:hypothetical protein
VDITQYSRLIGWGDLVNPLPGGAGFLQGFDGGDRLSRILRVDEQLLRHSMFQGGAEETSLQHELFFLDGVAVVDTGDRKQRDVEHDAPRFDGFGNAEKSADFRFIAEGAGTGPQLVMTAGLQAHDVVQPNQLRVVAQGAGAEQVAEQVFASQGGDWAWSLLSS